MPIPSPATQGRRHADGTNADAGNDTVTVQGNATVDGPILGSDGDDAIDNDGVTNANVSGDAGSDTLTNSGLVNGPMNGTYHHPERSFLYLLHAIRDETPNPRKVIDAEDWRMFLMRPADVEQELLRLHQYRKLDYQVAGSLVQLKLPCTSSCEYAEEMVA